MRFTPLPTYHGCVDTLLALAALCDDVGQALEQTEAAQREVRRAEFLSRVAQKLRAAGPPATLPQIEYDLFEALDRSRQSVAAAQQAAATARARLAQVLSLSPTPLARPPEAEPRSAQRPSATPPVARASLPEAPRRGALRRAAAFALDVLTARALVITSTFCSLLYFGLWLAALWWGLTTRG